MINDKKVVAIIPARGGSKRLPKKNIYPIWGKPMIYWAIRSCQSSNYIDDFFVSTENSEIKDVSIGFGANVIDRPVSLSEDWVYKQDAIVHAVQTLNQESGYKPDIVISLQSNSPEINWVDIDNAIEKLVDFNRSEIFSVDENLIQNAAFRIMVYDYVFQKTISTHCGVFKTNYVDVHDLDNVTYLEKYSHPAEDNDEKKNR